MNGLDLVMIGLAALSLVSGIRQGLSRSGFGLLAVIVAFLLAAWLYPGQPVGFAVVFGALVCAGAIGPHLLRGWFKDAELTWLDRVLGGAFGLTNAVLISVVAVLGMMAFAPGWSGKYVARSTFAPYAMETAYNVADAVPEEMKSRIEDTYREMGKALLPAVQRTTSSGNKI